MPKKNKDPLTITQAAKFIGVTRDAVIKAIKIRKTLPARKLGHIWVVEYKDAGYYKKHRKGKPGRPKNKEIKLPGF